MSLEALLTQIRWDLAALGVGGPGWVRPRSDPAGHVHDVVIVGGGQSGLGAAFGLIREGIANITVLDENPTGSEGPWTTYARMLTLRTPKHLGAIDLGVPSLTFRAWYEAQNGAEGWAALDKIPRETWMAYLRWYRMALDLPVVNDIRVIAVGPDIDGVHRLTVEGAGAPEGGVILARKVVLATGIQGGGDWHVPPLIADRLPRRLYAHSSGPLDYEALKGKRLAILGGGASAFDNAWHALQVGVDQAHVFMRRKVFQRVNPIRHMERSGLTGRFAGLDDDGKYRVMSAFFRRNQPPTNDTFERARALPGFHLHLGAPWLDIAETDDGRVDVTTPQGTQRFDFVLLSTGLVTDPALRPELGDLASGIARWRDRYSPPESLRDPVIDDHPYLGPAFQYLGLTAADQTRLNGIHAFNYSGLISMGLSASALSGLTHAIPRLVQGIAADLFRDDAAIILDEHLAYDEEEFTGAREASPDTQDGAAA